MKIKQRIGRRGIALVVFGLVFMGGAIQFISPDTPLTATQRDSARYLLEAVPVMVWGVVYVLGWLLCWSGSVFKRLEALAFGYAAFLYTLWGIGYAVAVPGALHPISVARGAVTQLSIAFFVYIVSTWEESP